MMSFLTMTFVTYITVWSFHVLFVYARHSNKNIISVNILLIRYIERPLILCLFWFFFNRFFFNDLIIGLIVNRFFFNDLIIGLIVIRRIIVDRLLRFVRRFENRRAEVCIVCI